MSQQEERKEIPLVKITLLRNSDVRGMVIRSERTEHSGEALSIGDMAMVIGKWKDKEDRK